jgi:hypothetical protein
LVAKVASGAPCTYLIEGTQVISSTDELVIQIIFYNLAGPGTYPIGVGPSVLGAVAQVAQVGKVWSTPSTGAAGTVTITALTPTRIAGMFEFVAGPYLLSTGTKTVTNGQFDLTLPGTALPTLPANAGSRVSASLDGAAWNAATVVALNASGSLSIAANNDDYQLSFTLIGVSAPGTYALSDTTYTRSVSVSPGPKGAPNGNCCWGFGTGQFGTITITSVTASRMAGTFEVTLPPTGGGSATSPIEITSGVFDVGFY